MKRLIVGLAAALLLVASLVGTASAYQVISETGPHGNYWIDDSETTPAGTCQYGKVVHSNWSYLEWMQVRAPHVFAADRNSATRDHRSVTWQWKLQRHAYSSDSMPSTGWKTVASSALQTKTAYEDAEAPFGALRINYDAYSHSVKPPTYDGHLYRALVIIKWLKPGGGVESTVKLIPDWYRLRTVYYGPITGGQPRCSAIATDG